MRSPDSSRRLAIVLHVAVGIVLGCGGVTHNDSLASGGAGQAGNSAGGQVGDGGDAGNSLDAGVCNPQTCEAFLCGIPRSCVISAKYIGSGANVIDCAIQLQSSPINVASVFVFVNCAQLPPATNYNDAGSSWNIDYSTFPARVVFGGDLCNQLKMNDSTPVYMLTLTCAPN